MAERKARGSPSSGKEKSGRTKTPRPSSAHAAGAGAGAPGDATSGGPEAARVELIERLKASPDGDHARDILSESNLTLVSSQASPAARKTFWQKILTDLDVAAQYSGLLVDPEDGRRLRGVISAARGTISQYLRILAYEERERTPPDEE
jgi:hypothetical protein